MKRLVNWSYDVLGPFWFGIAVALGFGFGFVIVADALGAVFAGRV